MDGLEALTKIIEATAWPLVAVVVIVKHKMDVTGLIKKVKSFKGWGAELEFVEKEVEKLDYQIVEVAADAVAKEEVLISRDASDEDRKQAARDFAFLVREVTLLTEQRQKLSEQLPAPTISPGHQQMLRNFVKKHGSHRIVDLTVEQLIAFWPTLSSESKNGMHSSGGLYSFGALAAAGVLTPNYGLTPESAITVLRLAKELHAAGATPTI